MGAQWKAKGKAQAADARGKLFGRLAKDIMIAARHGADPAANALPAAVLAAKTSCAAWSSGCRTPRAHHKRVSSGRANCGCQRMVSACLAECAGGGSKGDAVRACAAQSTRLEAMRKAHHLNCDTRRHDAPRLSRQLNEANTLRARAPPGRRP